MTRLIDADALAFTHDYVTADGEPCVTKAVIDNAPTIDAVPINRCKTCIFWDTDANEPDDLHNGLCTLNKIGTSDYFYCGAWTKDTHDFFNGDRDDWVSVVRCKDCKYWDKDTLRHNSNDVAEWDECECEMLARRDRWNEIDRYCCDIHFCADGERKDDE